MEIEILKRCNKVRYEFRQVAREVTRELYDVPEQNKVVFAYEIHSQTVPQQRSFWPSRESQEGPSRRRILCGVLSFSLANRSNNEQGAHFDSDFSHFITFLFVKPDNQRAGVGRRLVQEALKCMQVHAPERPVHVESAVGAAGFFEKMGFSRQGQAYETAYAGARIFHHMVNMELQQPCLDAPI